MKHIVIKIILIASGLLLMIPVSMFLFYLFDDKDSCLDIGICAQGLEINTQYGLVLINKENCLKYNWKWDEKTKSCNIND